MWPETLRTPVLRLPTVMSRFMCDQSTTQEAAAFFQKVLLLCSHALLGNWHKVLSVRSLYWVDLSLGKKGWAPLGKKDAHYKNFLLGSWDQKFTIKVNLGSASWPLRFSKTRSASSTNCSLLSLDTSLSEISKYPGSMTNIPFSWGKAIAGEKEDPNDNRG